MAKIVINLGLGNALEISCSIVPIYWFVARGCEQLLKHLEIEKGQHEPHNQITLNETPTNILQCLNNTNSKRYRAGNLFP